MSDVSPLPSYPLYRHPSSLPQTYTFEPGEVEEGELEEEEIQEEVLSTSFAGCSHISHYQLIKKIGLFLL